MNILALDLGTKTGYACYLDQQPMKSGAVDFSPERHEGPGMRYLRFSGWLSSICAEHHIDAIYYEAVERHLGTSAAHVYGGLLAHLLAFAEQHKIPHKGLPVGSIKKRFAGKGNATKNDMIECAKSHGFSQQSSDEADAIAVLFLALDDLSINSAIRSAV